MGLGISTCPPRASAVDTRPRVCQNKQDRRQNVATDRSIWGPNADDFEPDRWLAPDGQSLDQYMCAFSKGARGCLAQNLAIAEMYITIAMLFRQFDFTLDKRSLKAIKGLDRFTIALPEPGVLLRVKTRA
jgi:cytochrome P450